MEAGSFWWLVPLFGLVVMGIMAFICFRCFGRMSRGAEGGLHDIAELRREFQELKDDIKKRLQCPNCACTGPCRSRIPSQADH